VQISEVFTMKKILLLILIILLTATGSYAGPSISGGTSGGGGSGDVTAASDAQTWGGGTGPVVWTFSVTGTDPTISVATGAFTFNTDLALGANDITMTGSLGATGARVTKGWFTALEVTNAIAGSVTGNAATATALAADPADCPAGYVATGISASGALTCTNTLSVTIDDSAAQFKSATASKGTLKFDQTGLTDGKVLTIKHTSADDYTYTPTFTGNTAITFPTSGTLAVTSGALGTPSFTALNIPSGTGDAGTTAGQIVHDNNDTAGSANGNLEWFDGTNVRSIIDTGTTYTVITKTEFLPIAWAVNGATAPSAIAAVTGKEINARSFTEGDDVVFWWVVPNDYVGGIKYRVHYALSANASADETVIFSMAGSIVANSGDLDGSAGTALTITDELGTDDDQYQYMVTDYSAESNADWSLSAGGLARLNFSNSAAGDLASGEPLVIGIEIKYKAKIIGIAGY